MIYWIEVIYTEILKLFQVFERRLLCSQMLHLFDQKLWNNI